MTAAARLRDLPDAVSRLDDLWALVGGLEHEALDFKRGPDGLADTIAAMAMTSGGLILVGVGDDRGIRGCALTQDVSDRVTEAAHQCGVEVDVKAVRTPRGEIVAVEVPEVQKRIVTTPSGRLLRRYGSQSKPLIGDAMARFVMHRLGHSAEEELIDDERVFEAFDVGAINRALRKEGRPSVRQPGVAAALLDLGLAETSSDDRVRPTKAAVVLFGRDPRAYIPGACVQVVRRSGTRRGPGSTSLREEVYGPLPAVIDRVLDLIDRNTARYDTVIRTLRDTVPEYPPVALREAVANALAHRDYGLTGATVDVTIWDDRIEVRSPGSLAGHVTVENIRDEHFSRNRRIMRILKLLDLVEEYGEGVDRMFRAMEQRLMDPPSFVPSPASFSVVFRKHSLLSPEEQLWFSLLGQLELSRDERVLIAAIRRDGWTTLRRLRALLPEADVAALVESGLTKGLIRRTGQRGGARYLLSLELAVRSGDVVVPGGPRGASLELRSRQRQRLLDEVRHRGTLSVAEAAHLLPGESRDVARSLLDDLARSGALVVNGRTRGRRYVLADS